MSNYNDWFDREFAPGATTREEREAVMILGPEAAYAMQEQASAAPTTRRSAASAAPGNPSHPSPSQGIPEYPSNPSNPSNPSPPQGIPAAPAAPASILPPQGEGRGGASRGEGRGGAFATILTAKATTYRDYVVMVDRMKAYDFAYYQLAAPVISDEDYEQMKCLLLIVEELNPGWRLPDSPTATIGDDSIYGLPRVHHRTPMLSLQKCDGLSEDKKQEALKKWFKNTAGYDKPLCVEYKYDGNSVALVYQDGQLVEASTRGQDGTEGSLITPQIIGLPSVPDRINAAGRVEVRGELFIPDAAYDRLDFYDRAKTQQAQVRKVLEQTNRPELATEQGFEFRPFELIAATVPEGSPEGSPSHTARMQWLAKQGFIVGEQHTVTTYDDMLRVMADMQNHRHDIGIPTDGIVIKLDNDADRECFGATAHHPKWAIAYKYPATVLTVTVTKVGTTRTGKPSLHFDRQQIGPYTFAHVDVKTTPAPAFAPGDTITIALKTGSSSIQYVGKGAAALTSGAAAAGAAPAASGAAPAAAPAATGAAAPASGAAPAAAPDIPDIPANPNPSQDIPAHPSQSQENPSPSQDIPAAPASPFSAGRCSAAASPAAPAAPAEAALSSILPPQGEGRGGAPILTFTLSAVAAGIVIAVLWETGLFIPAALLGLAVSAAK